MTSLRFALAPLFSALIALAHAQDCGAPTAGFHLPGTNQPVYASVIWDDGSGPALYVGGVFSSIGPIAARGVARFDGSSWSTVGQPLGTVYALTVYNGMLYAGGAFLLGGMLEHVARFDGTSWSALTGGGTDSAVFALEVFQGQLYLGGSFDTAGGISAPNIARYDGASWSYPSGGPIGGGAVHALKAFDDGSGSKLYVGGGFWWLGAPGTFANGMARYNSSTWSTMDGGMLLPNGATGRVDCLEVFDSGSGAQLYAGGIFDRAGGAPINGVARWTGSDWTALGSGIVGNVRALRSHADGTSSSLYATGEFAAAGGVPARNIARWDGATWTALGSGVSRMGSMLASFQGTLVTGGEFLNAGGRGATRLARYASGAWSPLHPGFGLPTWGGVSSLAVYDAGGGAGPELYVGIADDTELLVGEQRYFRRDSDGWTGIGLTDGQINSAVAFDDGSGPKLFVVGDFHEIGGTPATGFAVWDGTSWTAPSAGTWIHALRVLDDGTGPALYAAGSFVARWTGSAWQMLGAALPGNAYDLAVYDGGNGPRIYAVGGFHSVQAFDPSNSAWTSVGALDNSAVTVAVHDDGSGAQLYVGGNFSSAGGVGVVRVARWNGSTWSAVGAGLGLINGAIEDFLMHDSGTGPHLVACGNFLLPNGGGLAEWDGTQWRLIAHATQEQGFETRVTEIVSFGDDLGNGPDLWVGGAFTALGSTPSLRMGRIEGCATLGIPLCFGVACPCANNTPPAAQSGCRHAFGTGGRLVAEGTARITSDTYVLAGSSMPSTSSVLYFAGTSTINGGAGAVFGDGLRCAGGVVRRLGSTANVGGASMLPNASSPAPLSLLDPVLPGEQRVYQAWYRNAVLYCTSYTFNLTNAWRVNWSL
jgi:trimeric autotransporter adhesin